MSYKIISTYSDTSDSELAEVMELAEQKGYRYVGSAGRAIIMHRREGPAHLRAWNLARIAELLQSAVSTDGGHHKQWYLEQAAAQLEVTLPEHEAGIAP